jgi:hypothetical protein
MRSLRIALCLALSVALTGTGPAVAAPEPAPALQAACVTFVGPPIPAPTEVTTGIPGYHSAWYGQSGYASLCPHGQAEFSISFLNTGTLGWYLGSPGQTAYLGTWGPEPGQDRATQLGGDGTLGTPNTGWPQFNRVAAQAELYIGPGEVASFRFMLQAPKVPGWYRVHLRPLIEGTAWLEDQGIYWQIVVLDEDGTVPVEPDFFTTESTVRASWYGPGFFGRRTACGQIMSTVLAGVAHRTLPCGTPVTLRYGDVTLTVPVVDRGPFIAGREFDLTYATRVALGCPDICHLLWLR